MSATTSTWPFGQIRTRLDGCEPAGGGGPSGAGPAITAYVLPSPFVATSTAPGTVAIVRELPLRSSSIAPVALSTTSRLPPGPFVIPRGLARPPATVPPEAAAVATTTAASRPTTADADKRAVQTDASCVRFIHPP